MGDEPLTGGERLVALETEMRLLRQTLDRISIALERLATNQIKVEQFEVDLKRGELALDALDKDLDSLVKQLNNTDKELAQLKYWITSRYWAAAAIIGVLTTGLQLLFKFLEL